MFRAARARDVIASARRRSFSPSSSGAQFSAALRVSSKSADSRRCTSAVRSFWGAAVVFVIPRLCGHLDEGGSIHAKNS